MREREREKREREKVQEQKCPFRIFSIVLYLQGMSKVRPIKCGDMLNRILKKGESALLTG